MYEKTIICLANSKKPPSGRCIAGKEVEDEVVGGWIRPVSNRPKHEVSEDERSYDNGRKVQLLDIVTVPFRSVSPLGHQIENHTLHDEYYWTKEGTATWHQVNAIVDPNDRVFWSHSQSTYHGHNDKVAEDDLAQIGSSLRLTRVHDLTIRVQSEDGYQGAPSRRRVRGEFTLLGQHYLLSVTDPVVEEQYLARNNGEYNIGEAILCISLVEVHYGYAFRVIASVITPDRCAA
jgi:hypothetical protein